MTKKENKIGLGGKLDWLIAGLIIISVIGFSVETLPDLKPTTVKILQYIEWCTIVIFAAEYIYRVFKVEYKLKFIFSFYGIIDFIAFAPYLLFPFLDLRALRLLRFIRFIRIMKLARYNNALLRFGKALAMAKEEIIISVVGTAVLVYLSAIGIYYFEHKAQPDVFKSVFDALWWSIATVTTVGYGDIYPITTGGRIFTMVILFIGLGLVAGTTGIFSSALLKIRNEDLEDE
jgi:voltage-gated potassium channel